MPPLVSIIIPSYQSSETILRAISSVFIQDYENIEIIIVDDHSTDHTGQLLEAIIKTDQRVKYFYLPENLGPAGSRNKGVSMAEGEYIAFLDADDEWLPEKLDQQIKFLGNHPEIDLIFSDSVILDLDSKSKTIKSAFNYLRETRIDLLPDSTKEEIFFLSGDIHSAVYRKDFIPLSSVLMKKSSFHQKNGFNKKRRGTEDIDLWVRLASSGKFAYWHVETVNQYRMQSNISTMNERWLLELINYHQMCKISPEYVQLRELVINKLSESYRALIVFYGQNWDIAKSWRLFFLSMSNGFDFKALILTIMSVGGPFLYGFGKRLMKR